MKKIIYILLFISCLAKAQTHGNVLFNVNNLPLVTAVFHVETYGNPAVGVAAPIRTFLANTDGDKFGVGDEIYFNFIFPAGIDTASEMEIDLHFYSSNTTAARYVNFQIDYTAVIVGGDVSTGSVTSNVTTGDILLSTSANTLMDATLNIPVPNLAYTDDPHFFFKISRIASAGTAPAVGDNPVVVHTEFEYVVNQIGQTAE